MTKCTICEQHWHISVCASAQSDQTSFVSCRDNMRHVMRKPFLCYMRTTMRRQPAHSHSQISAFIVRCLETITPIVALPDISGLCLASVAVQTDLSLSWFAHTVEDRFSHDVAQL